MWQVKIKAKAVKNIRKLPVPIIKTAQLLVEDLKIKGPFPGKKWKNYSKLGKNEHHCHLAYSYVACWKVLNGEIQIMEVYYVGSRENAPY